MINFRSQTRDAANIRLQIVRGANYPGEITRIHINFRRIVFLCEWKTSPAGGTRHILRLTECKAFSKHARASDTSRRMERRLIPFRVGNCTFHCGLEDAATPAPALSPNGGEGWQNGAVTSEKLYHFSIALYSNQSKSAGAVLFCPFPSANRPMNTPVNPPTISEDKSRVGALPKSFAGPDPT